LRNNEIQTTEGQTPPSCAFKNANNLDLFRSTKCHLAILHVCFLPDLNTASLHCTDQTGL